MAEPVPAVGLAGIDAQAVIALEALRNAPLMPRHFAAARDRQHALLGVGRKLREEAGRVGGGRDEARGGCHRVGRIVAGDHAALAQRQFSRVAARERRALGKRRVRLGLAQACGLDDLALDPDGVGLLRHGFDHEAEQAKAVIGIFEARAGLDRGRQLQLREQLLGVEIGAAVDELAGIGAVARQPGAVREHLRDRRLGDARMQAADILADRIVEPELALLAQLHDAGRGKALRVRGDAEAVARGQLLAGVEIGEAECMLGDDLAAMGEGDDDAGLLECRLLEFDPGADVVDRGSQPIVHCAPICEGEYWCERLAEKAERAQPQRLCPFVSFEDALSQ